MQDMRQLHLPWILFRWIWSQHRWLYHMAEHTHTPSMLLLRTRIHTKSATVWKKWLSCAISVLH